MMLADDYLDIPQEYGGWLGGLRWSRNGEAIEFIAHGTQTGLTYAMGVEVARFLEGLSSDGDFLHFGHVLHILDVLGYGLRRDRRDPNTEIKVEVRDLLDTVEMTAFDLSNSSPAIHFTQRPAEFMRLAKAFRESGWSLRNAGSLFGMVCAALPKVPDPPSLDAVVFRLTDRSLARYAWLGRISVCEPPLSPVGFETRMAQALSSLSDEEVRHWLKHGRGSVADAGEKVVRALPPPTVAEILSAVESRPRLKGSRALVARLSGALSLPPRKLAAAELPVGGYTDVATRGLPEQILPFQFALDPDEFLRRFAERELLYFHREEPRTPTSRELMIVLDQGVRTWGDVRLVLASAALALAKQADRKGQEVRFAATSHCGLPLDPVVAGEDALGALLDASDLSPEPGATLAAVLADLSDEPRDVVLLTHPRNLAEPGVVAAGSAVRESTRLFAVAVSPEGAVELSIMRQGRPVVIGRCRVDVNERPGGDDTPHSPAQSVAIYGAWRGDVEKVPFPFRVGPTDPIADHLFAFDDSGEWILLADRFGLLRLRRVNGSGGEMMPRAESSKHGLLVNVEAVVGVAGGFVVIGFQGAKRLAAHYDLRARSCVSYEITAVQQRKLSWTYLRRFHTVIGHEGAAVWSGLDLGAETPGVVFPSKEPYLPRTREALLEWSQKPVLLRMIHDAAMPLRTDEISPSVMGGLQAPHKELDFKGSQAVGLDRDGRLHIREGTEGWRSFIPQSDGRLRLKGCSLIRARWQGVILAVLVAHKDGRRELLAFSVWGEWRVLGEFWPERSVDDFAMSRDGRRIAWRSSSREVLVRDLEHVAPPMMVVNKGRAHSSLEVDLGAGFLSVQAGRHAHLIRWDGGRLVAIHFEGTTATLIERLGGKLGPPSVWRATAWPGTVSPYWKSRFFAAATKAGLTVAVDRLGQVSVFGPSENLLCMFFFFRHQFAAWAPDGTRMGPLPLIGGPETPSAPERIGKTLNDASNLSHSKVKSQIDVRANRGQT